MKSKNSVPKISFASLSWASLMPSRPPPISSSSSRYLLLCPPSSSSPSSMNSSIPSSSKASLCRPRLRLFCFSLFFLPFLFIPRSSSFGSALNNSLRSSASLLACFVNEGEIILIESIGIPQSSHAIGFLFPLEAVIVISIIIVTVTIIIAIMIVTIVQSIHAPLLLFHFVHDKPIADVVVIVFSVHFILFFVLFFVGAGEDGGIVDHAHGTEFGAFLFGFGCISRSSGATAFIVGGEFGF
mmetsp:Transcript_8483/g.12058  ORF Transcript_8483/g.12058 Transcript_8483/m.12058 type:complete len:241 (+) Transcript_8483:536-1258(+)